MWHSGPVTKKRQSVRYDTAASGVFEHHPRAKGVVRDGPCVEPGSLSRQRDLDNIAAALESHLVLSDSGALVAEGDSLPLLKALPDHSVSLVLTDPPYHATKKDNIYGDTAFAEDQHYLDWMTEYAVQWRRVLRPNGSLFLFCDSSMAGRLEVRFSAHFNVLSRVVWTKPNDPGFDGWKGKMKKEALRQWYPHSERILFAEPAMEGNLHRSPFGQFLRQARQQAGLTMHQLTARIGAHGKVNHGGAVSNWEDGRNTPSRDQYQRICEALVETGKLAAMPPYEDVIRVFTMDATKEFTDVWTFPSVRPYKGKHPAEKPASLLEHAILATTYPGDIVLDCFAGSGSTAIAALKLQRRTVSIEIEAAWAARIAARVQEFRDMESILRPEPVCTERPPRVARYQSAQMALFPVAK
jgi:site-specific DNA-methyltransferase (adenine-specific)